MWRKVPFLVASSYLLAVVVRLLFYTTFPVFVTNDSWDYIGAAHDIYLDLNFYSQFLRDVRLPGYPTWLALLYPLQIMQSDHLVLYQIMLGLGSVALGWLIGRLLHSPLVSIGLVLFLGLNPVYLLAEHTLMTETLFLFTLLAFVCVVLICWLRNQKDKPSWWQGIGLGATMSICILTRANALPFCLLLMAGVLLQPYIFRKSTENSGNIFSQKHNWGFVAMLFITVVLFFAPWLWRNYVLFGNLSLVNFNNRNLLIYKEMHYPLDNTLPLLTATNRQLNAEKVSYGWLWQLAGAYPTVQAEALAGQLVQEQIVAYPLRHLAQLVESFAGFGGFYYHAGGERTSVLFWFSMVANDITLIHANNTPVEIAKNFPYFVYIATGENTLPIRLWSRAGVLFLRFIRPLLYATFFVSLLLYALYLKRSLTKWNLSAIWSTITSRESTGDTIIIFASAGYLLTAVAHAVTLTDSDRYAAPFDWISLLVILLICERLWPRRMKDLRFLIDD